jgi:hypothetical protein
MCRFARFVATAMSTVAVGPIVWLTSRAGCALSGHRMVLHFERDRLSLQCLGCGAETPGWRLEVKPAFRLRPRVVTAIVAKSSKAGDLNPKTSSPRHAIKKIAAAIVLALLPVLGSAG